MTRKCNFLVNVYAVIDFFTIAVVSFSFGVSSSLHQSPIWIKASLVMRGPQRDPFPAERGPENLRLLTVSKTGITDLVVVSQPQGGSRHGQ
jgi:hypothetical protein